MAMVIPAPWDCFPPRVLSTRIGLGWRLPAGVLDADLNFSP